MLLVVVTQQFKLKFVAFDAQLRFALHGHTVTGVSKADSGAWQGPTALAYVWSVVAH